MAKKQNCLRCDSIFSSTGPGNRLCTKCNSKNSISTIREPIKLYRTAKQAESEFENGYAYKQYRSY